MTADEVGALVDSARSGDRGSIARLVSIVESGGDEARTAAAALRSRAGSAVLGITGAPGAGKSTLTDRLVGRFRSRGERVAVLAIDPTSPFTGGAILGDRIRMQSHDTDDGVFVRSMASRGHLGGLSRAAPQALAVLEAAAFGRVLVETVGVGQVEVAIAATADTTVVVVNPGWGDGVQATKAGLLEIGDVFVVNKADRDGTDATVRDLRAMLALAGSQPWTPPIVETVATEGRGTDSLVGAIDAHREYLTETGELARRHRARTEAELRGIVLEQLQAEADRYCAGETFDAAVDGIAVGALDPYTAAELLHPDRRGGAPAGGDRGETHG